MILSRSENEKGFTLIEMMIVVAIIGIFMVILIQMQIQNDKFAQSEVELQKAAQALRSEIDFLRIIPYSELKPGTAMPFDASVKILSELAAGRGEVSVERDKTKPQLLMMRVEVFWRDARTGMRSIHSIVARAP